MATPQFFEGDAYGDEPRRPSMLPMVLVLAGTLGAVGLGAWLLFGAPTERDPLEKTGNLLANIPPWGGIQATPARAAIPEQDKRYDDLMKLMEAEQAERARMMQEHAAFRKAIEELSKQRQAPAGTPKKQNAHRVMAATYFEPPKDGNHVEVLHELLPGDTKIPCQLETKVVSSVESIYTAKVTANVYNSNSRQHVLIPQGATVLGHYQSKQLLYGEERLPMWSTKIVALGQEPIELEETPLLTGEGTAGLATRVDHHFWRAAAAFFIQGVGRGSQQAIANAASGGADQVVVSAGQSANQFTQHVTRPWISLAPTIFADPGEDCILIPTRTLKLPAYKGAERGILYGRHGTR